MNPVRCGIGRTRVPEQQRARIDDAHDHVETPIVVEVSNGDSPAIKLRIDPMPLADLTKNLAILIVKKLHPLVAAEAHVVDRRPLSQVAQIVDLLPL